jgi:hypothetical protein
MVLLFQEKKIRVIRMGLQATADLDGKGVILAGPYHPAFGHLVFSEIYFDRAVVAITAAGGVGKSLRSQSVEIRVSPRCISRMRGDKNRNIRRLKEMLGITVLAVIPDPSVEEGRVAIRDRT